MPTRKPPPDSVLFRAVEARATGAPWAAVGKLVRRSPHTVCKWPRTYPERWEAALRAAGRNVIDYTAARAVVVLNNLLNSKNERLQAEAAWRLVYQRLEQWKIELRSLGMTLSGNQTQDDPHTQSIRNLSREKRLLLLANLRSTPLAGIDGDRPLPPARAG